MTQDSVHARSSLRYDVVMNAVTFQATRRHRAVIAKLVDFIAAIPEVHCVLLFGSRARGDADERSDFDIAIDAPRLTRDQWVDILHAAEDAETLLEIQIVDLRETDSKFRSRVMSEGVILYEREKAFGKLRRA